MPQHVAVADLKGKILSNVVVKSDSVHFETINGESFIMEHDQDCCESVTIEDVCGDVKDLIGVPIVMAQEVYWGPELSTNSTKKGAISQINSAEYCDQSYTWTFYKFATIKGYVTIRWYGSSNGYYSESVSFKKMD